MLNAQLLEESNQKDEFISQIKVEQNKLSQNVDSLVKAHKDKSTELEEAKKLNEEL